MVQECSLNIPFFCVTRNVMGKSVWTWSSLGVTVPCFCPFFKCVCLVGGDWCWCVCVCVWRLGVGAGRRLLYLLHQSRSVFQR